MKKKEWTGTFEKVIECPRCKTKNFVQESDLYAIYIPGDFGGYSFRWVCTTCERENHQTLIATEYELVVERVIKRRKEERKKLPLLKRLFS